MPILIAVRAEGLKAFAKDIRTADRKMARRMGKRLKEAGDLVAKDARRRAAWSSRIPATIKVTGGSTSVSVKAGGPTAPHAEPYQGPSGRAQFRHPVYGRRRQKWAVQVTRPYLRAALEANASQVGEIVAKVIDDFTADAGFR